MTAAGVLARAHAAGLAVVAEGGNLRLRGAAKPPADLLADLRMHKAEVLALLTEPANDPAPVPPPPPADAAALLRHIRDTLGCRVTLEGGTVTIRPTHRCPPPVVAAVLAVLPAVRCILKTETGAGGADV